MPTAPTALFFAGLDYLLKNRGRFVTSAERNPGDGFSNFDVGTICRQPWHCALRFCTPLPRTTWRSRADGVFWRPNLAAPIRKDQVSRTNLQGGWMVATVPARLERLVEGLRKAGLPN